MNVLGENIRQLRKAKELTQEQLALQMGVSRRILQRWETGEVVPCKRNIRKMELFLGGSINTAAKVPGGVKTLSELRREMKITQKELAKKVGVSHVTVSNWEMGKVPMTKETYALAMEIFGEPFQATDRQLLYKAENAKEEKERLLAKKVPKDEKEIRLLKTFYNVRDLLRGKLTVRDVIDILYEHIDVGFCMECLRKWKFLGFYRTTDYKDLDQGIFMWMLVPGKYMEEIKRDEH